MKKFLKTWVIILGITAIIALIFLLLISVVVVGFCTINPLYTAILLFLLTTGLLAGMVTQRKTK